MKKYLATTSLLCLLAAPCAAQTAVGVGTGVANSRSDSASGALAVNRGNGNSNSSLTVNNPANTTSTSTLNQTVSGGTRNTNEVTGTSTIKNVPGTLAPGLTAAGIESCLGSVSGGGSIVGFGGSFGTTVPDPNCNTRLDARALWSIGLKAAAVARLCQSPDIARSMPDVCARYAPVVPVQVEPYNYGYGRPAVAALAAAPGGPIEVVEGRTGRTRMCDNYSESRSKCLAWTGAPPRPTALAMSRKKKAVIETASASPSTPVAAIAAAVESPPK